MLRNSEDNLPLKYLKNIEKKALQALLVKEFVFNSELENRDSGCCVNTD